MWKVPFSRNSYFQEEAKTAIKVKNYVRPSLFKILGTSPDFSNEMLLNNCCGYSYLIQNQVLILATWPTTLKLVVCRLIPQVIVQRNGLCRDLLLMIVSELESGVWAFLLFWLLFKDIYMLAWSSPLVFSKQWPLLKLRLLTKDDVTCISSFTSLKCCENVSSRAKYFSLSHQLYHNDFINVWELYSQASLIVYSQEKTLWLTK